MQVTLAAIHMPRTALRSLLPAVGQCAIQQVAFEIQGDS